MMKQLHFLIAPLLACILVLMSCNDSPNLQTGDIIFVSIPYEKPGADPLFIHTAIVEINEAGEQMIVDATYKRGIAEYPIDSFISDYQRHDGSYPTFEVYRLKDTTDIDQFIANAKAFIGESYDVEFVPDNGRHYCTELIYDSYVRNGQHIFDQTTLDFHDADGDYPAFWVKIFGRLGAEIPFGTIGTPPLHMHSSDAIEYVTNIEPNL